MLLIFYTGNRISNILHSLITYLPQNKLGFVLDTSNILNLAGTPINLCMRALLHALMRIEYTNTYRVHKFLKKLELDRKIQFTDLDLAISIFLNESMVKGVSFSELLEKLRTQFSIDAQIIPVSDQNLPISVRIGQKIIPYSNYVQVETSEGKIQEILFNNYEDLKPSGNLKKLANNSEYILLAPNDLIAFHAILQISPIKKILEDVPCPVFAICPINPLFFVTNNQKTILQRLGYSNLNAFEFSKTVQKLADTIIIDESQRKFTKEISNLGFQVRIGNLAIKNKTESFDLANFLFDLFPLKDTARPSKANVVTQFFSRLVKKKI
ncbi:MAG: 2-phospho-L-lactate transferase CofD family protein [Candidatus Helarchaeota archaeon]